MKMPYLFYSRVVKQRLGKLCASLSLAFFSLFSTAQTEVGGVILSNTVWYAERSPYIVVNDLLVKNGATLAIEAGTTVYMGPNVSLTIETGALKAIGSAQAPIRLTSKNLLDGKTPAPGDWRQLIFGAGTANETQLEHVIIEYGDGVVVAGASPVFNYLTIDNNRGAAISADLTASLRGMGNKARGNGSNAIILPPGDIDGSVTWGINGIPFVIPQGNISVGTSPNIISVSPQVLEQGETGIFTLLGTRLEDLSDIVFDNDAITTQIINGGTDTQVQLRITAAPHATLGAAGATILVAGGKAIKPAILTILPITQKLLSVAPPSIFVGSGDQTIDIEGKNLLPTTVAELDGIALATTYTSDSRLLATLPNQPLAGLHTLRLRTQDPLNEYLYTLSAPLLITVQQPQAVFVPDPVSMLKGSSQHVAIQLPFTAPADGLVFDLNSSDPLVVDVPSNVMVLPGQSMVTFAAQAVGAGMAILTLSRTGWLAAQTSTLVWSSLPLVLAEYRFDETQWTGATGEVIDSSINANHGTALQGATTALSKLCAGGYFDGATNRHVVLSPTIQEMVTNTFTMMLWVKPGRDHQI
ncbi:MAG: hypothetical protein LBV29_07870, partial [Azoarcus sp.]|nr:hypothetical protein [Azoarcus sp.]